MYINQCNYNICKIIFFVYYNLKMNNYRKEVITSIQLAASQPSAGKMAHYFSCVPGETKTKLTKIKKKN